MPYAPEKFKLGGLGSTLPRPDTSRPNAQKRGYNARWQRARKSYMAKHPVCVECKHEGRVIAATDLDHITPHRGDKVIFWDKQCVKCHTAKAFGQDCPSCGYRSNLQSLCKGHHSQKTARGE